MNTPRRRNCGKGKIGGTGVSAYGEGLKKGVEKGRRRKKASEAAGQTTGPELFDTEPFMISINNMKREENMSQVGKMCRIKHWLLERGSIRQMERGARNRRIKKDLHHERFRGSLARISKHKRREEERINTGTTGSALRRPSSNAGLSKGREKPCNGKKRNWEQTCGMKDFNLSSISCGLTIKKRGNRG